MARTRFLSRSRRGDGSSSEPVASPLGQQTPEEFYRTQPHLRTVVSFVARNVAHLGLKAYARDADGGRRRLRTDPLARLLLRPNDWMTGFELLEDLVSNLGLHDEAYWLVAEASSPSGWTILPLPRSWIAERHVQGLFDEVTGYTLQLPGGARFEVPAEAVLAFHGYNPGRPNEGASPVETLKQILGEQASAWEHRHQLWENGARVSAVVVRPAGVKWSEQARERFKRSWAEQWSGVGGKAGGTPILEDGMTLQPLRFSARENEWADVAKIALSTVAAVYHVSPVMVGILDDANLSNTREFHKMLYTETLGPLLAMIEDRINTFLVPHVASAPDAYVEFNIDEKLQGDFAEQAAVLSQATGAPWMTRNEARALRNLPVIEGGDEMVVPLNVLVGGQASPRDSGSQNRR